jgi:hypothetical protein
MAAAKDNKSTETVKVSRMFDDESLANIHSFDDALKLVGEVVGEDNILVADQVLGDGFKLLDNKEKDTLNGVPFLAVNWQFVMGDFEEYVSVKLVTQDGRKLIVNDGGTGICQQLRTLSNTKKVYSGLFVKNGLRKSEYTYTGPDGKETPATTYYLDTSA